MTNPVTPPAAAGAVPAPEPARELRVAPTDVASERNQVRELLRPVDAWRVEDVHFAFDSSAILPSMAGDLARLRVMLFRYAGHPISIFGHTDTTGNDEYNKRLSGRRALALYGLLTRRPDLWDQLYGGPAGGDDWKKLGVVDQVFRPFLESAGQGVPTGAPRARVFSAYMDALCQDQEGRPFGVSAKAFLGQGADAGGKADYQGCSELNPVVVFSREETQRFAKPELKAERDEQGAANRRVVAFFFPPSSVVTPAKWPCPRALEGLAGCRKRLWSDAATRRTPGAQRREHPRDPDTFACRFYDRLGREPIDPGSIRLRLVVPGRAHRSPAELLLRATSGPAQVEVENPTPVGADPRGMAYQLFDLSAARRMPRVAAQMEKRTPPPATERAEPEPEASAPEAGASERGQPASTTVGIDVIALMAQLKGPLALVHSLGFPIGPPPTPTPLEPPPGEPPDPPPVEFENPEVPERPDLDRLR